MDNIKLYTPATSAGVFIFDTMKSVGFFFGFAAILCCTSYTTFTKAPAGTSSVPNLRNVFLDKVEVTNQDWRSYLQALQSAHGSDSKEFLNALPDTAVWHLSYKAPFLNSQASDDYPVVGINYKQAVEYCRWRSEMISSKEHRNIKFSLPTVKVYKLTQARLDHNKVAEGLYSTKLGFRSFIGLCDNAAEVTSEKGVAIKGSEREVCLETYQYTLPSHSLGFRCMAEVK